MNNIIIFSGVIGTLLVSINLLNNSNDKNLLRKKLIDVGVGIGTIYCLTRILPTVVKFLK